MSTRTMFATAAVAIGSSVTLLFGSVTGVADAEPGPPATTADRRAPGPGPAGGAESRTRHSAGRRRSDQRGIHADGRRRGVRRRRRRPGRFPERRVGRQSVRRPHAGSGCCAGHRGAPARGGQPGPRSRSRAGGRRRHPYPPRRPRLPPLLRRLLVLHRKPRFLFQRRHPSRIRPPPRRPPRPAAPNSVRMPRRRRTSCIRRSATAA